MTNGALWAIYDYTPDREETCSIPYHCTECFVGLDGADSFGPTDTVVAVYDGAAPDGHKVRTVPDNGIEVGRGRARSHGPIACAPIATNQYIAIPADRDKARIVPGDILKMSSIGVVNRYSGFMPTYSITTVHDWAYTSPPRTTASYRDEAHIIPDDGIKTIGGTTSIKFVRSAAPTNSVAAVRDIVL